MKKSIRFILVALFVLFVIGIAAYILISYLHEKEVDNAVARAKKVNFEIISEEKSDGAGKFLIYYPKNNPSAQDMRDLATLMHYEKSQDLYFIAVNVYNDRESATLMQNIDHWGDDIDQNKMKMKSATSHHIMTWDSLSYKAIAGPNYKYLDQVDVRVYPFLHIPVLIQSKL